MSVLAHLARPGGASDLHRSRLVSVGLAAVGAVILAAVAIATTSSVEPSGRLVVLDGTLTVVYPLTGPGLARYLTEPGLRSGTVFGVSLLLVPCLTFTVLALRTGTAARERRLAALSLAGATGRQLRSVAAQEGARAAVRGSVLAVPIYLALWLVLGVALPAGWRLLPTPTWLLAGVWVVLAVLLLALGTIAGVLASDVARVSPLGVSRRARRPLGPADVVLPIFAALVVVAAIAAWLISVSYRVQAAALYGGILGVLGLALTCGRWLVQAVARDGADRGPVNMLAGRRLLADVRTPGRVAGVLLSCGVTFALVGATIASTVSGPYSHDHAFFVVGALAAGAGGLFTLIIGCAALVMTAGEQVLDDRRGIAVLVSLAASPGFVQQIVRRQLVLAAVPPTVIGAALGVLLYIPINVHAVPWALLSLPLALVFSWLGATGAARGVRATVRDCASPDNLRAS